EGSAVEGREYVGSKVVVEDTVAAAQHGTGSAKGPPGEADAGLKVVPVGFAQRTFGESRLGCRDNRDGAGKQRIHVLLEDRLVRNYETPVLRVHVEDCVPLVARRLVVVVSETVAERECRGHLEVVLKEAAEEVEAGVACRTDVVAQGG